MCLPIRAVDLLEDILIDMGVTTYSARGWNAMNIYPNLARFNDTLSVKITSRKKYEIIVIGSIVDIVFSEPFKRPTRFSVDLADPESIDKFKIIVDFKRSIKDTSSPA